MKRVWHIGLLLTAAMTGSAILLVGLIVLTEHLMTYRQPPAAFLPSQQTIALAHEGAAPLLGFTGSTTTALLRTADNVVDIHFRKRTGNDNTFIAGAYQIDTSDPSALGLLTETGTLADDSTYRHLLASYPHTAGWLFLKKPTRVGATLTKRVLLKWLFSETNAIGIERKANKVAIHRVQTEPLPAAPVGYPELTDADTVISSGNMTALWSTILQSNSADDRIILEGLLTQTVRDAVAANVSLTHTALPLVSGPTTIQLAHTGGVITYLVSGEAHDRKAMAKHLNTLHESVVSALPANRIVTRTLDNRFSATDIRYDNDVISDDYKEVSSWQIRATGIVGEDTTIVSATLGNRFLLSNNQLAIRKAIEEITPAPLAESGWRTVAYGKMNAVDLAFTQPQLTFSGSILWQITQLGDVLRIRIE